MFTVLTKKSKFILYSLMLVLSFLMVAQAVLADDTGATKALNGLNTTAQGGYGVNQAGLDSNSNIPTMVGKIVGAGLAFLGVVFFILILYAGLSWILSLGNEEKITQAKDIIMAAVLGLIVVLGAYAITYLTGTIFFPPR
jgi:cbb3-type cytochrome oxidase subunit 3